MTARFARVALPLPLAAPYTYRIPETLGDRILPGARVVVPVRAREIIGIALEIDTPAPEAEAREILAAPDPTAALPEPLLATARWIAGYYGAPIGLTLKAMLPAGMWGASQVVAVRVRRTPESGGLAGQVLELHRSGKIRVLAVTSPVRLTAAPELPTATEAEFPGLVVPASLGLLAPAGTPKPIIEEIAQAMDSSVKRRKADASGSHVQRRQNSNVTGGSRFGSASGVLM